ncbi:MAG: hypothetical protein Q9208_000074 [Pyrenodesmia sp. 3 TL-2023]
MDSPDRMSWTPSSSSRKRKYNDFIDNYVRIRVPGAYPQSPGSISCLGRDQYLYSPTSASHFVRLGLSPQMRASMLDNHNVPMFFRPLYEMAAHAGSKVYRISATVANLFVGPGGRAIQYIQDNCGPLSAVVQAVGNAAKRIKLTVQSQPLGPDSHAHPGPSTPPRRISSIVNRAPTPAHRTQTSILRGTRETGLRKTRKTLRWVEEQQLMSEASISSINYHTNHSHSHPQMSFEPVMSGALRHPYPSNIETMVFDESDTVSASSSSSDFSDSVTSSIERGLDAEDLEGMETREEKKTRKKQEVAGKAVAIATCTPPTRFANELRSINQVPPPPPPPPTTKQVVFYDSPRHRQPITFTKEYDTEDPLTPPVRPSHTAIEISTRPVLRKIASADPSTTKETDRNSVGRLQSTPEAPPVTPESVGRDLSSLGFSQRRSSGRLDELAAQAQLRRDAEVAEAARRAIEDAEKRTRLGVRRMPTGPVIQPLTEEWNAKVDRAMQKRLEVDLVKTSTGEQIRRRDFGTVLPVPGVDDPNNLSGWLNDTIITAYLQAVTDYAQKLRGVKKGSVPKVFAFNTYFYKNLSGRGYDSVRRWATKAKFGGKDVLKMEKIFIPLHKGHNHWVLVHINPQTKTVEYYDSFYSPSPDVFENIKVWLRGELKDAFVESEWTFLDGKLGPKQNNSYDCGVFCTTTAKMIVLGVDPRAFSQSDMMTQRRVMLAELLNGGLEGDFTPNITFLPEPS